MKNVKELKQSVALRMRRCWGESCAMFLISAGGFSAIAFAWYLTWNFLVTTDVINNFTDAYMLMVIIVFSIVVWMVAVPYKYGSRWYRLQQVRGHSVPAKSIFSCYFSAKRMFQVYKLSAVLIFKKALILIPFILFLGMMVYFILRLDAGKGDVLHNFLVALLLLLSVLVCLVYTMICVKYSATTYLFALGHDRPAGEIIKESKRFMKGKNRYMADVFRELGFMLLPCLLVFPMFFILPYVKMIYTAVINEIIENGFEEDKLIDMERRE